MGEEGPGHEGGVHGRPDGEGAAAADDAPVPRGSGGAGGTHQDVAQMQVTSMNTQRLSRVWGGRGW